MASAARIVQGTRCVGSSSHRNLEFRGLDRYRWRVGVYRRHRRQEVSRFRFAHGKNLVGDNPELEWHNHTSYLSGQEWKTVPGCDVKRVRRQPAGDPASLRLRASVNPNWLCWFSVKWREGVLRQ